jgi:isoleucyl-tRNA synthetase
MNKTFPQIEEEIIKFWDKDKTFAKSVNQRDEKNSYVFYDGPPFATGLPHYGHLVGSVMKDIVPRYWTMKGKRVERRWGWDCHGLPIENIVEQELKLNGRQEIEKYGIDKFNEACRSKVGLYAEEWKKVIHRLARWVDMENDYKTMDIDFMESAWWVFKSLWDKDLIYEGRKSMHICPRCETTLSNMEVSQGYKDVKDLSLTAKFELEEEPGTFILAWTTTPWTLIGNVALAVGNAIEYVKVKYFVADKDDKEAGRFEQYILATQLVEKVFENKQFEIIEKFKGKKLVGIKYKPLFDFYLGKELLNKENFYKVVAADFVSTEEGTGTVHIAPAFGEDDMLLGQEEKLPFVQHIGMDGVILDGHGKFSGLHVKPEGDIQKTDVEIIKYLAGAGLLFDKKQHEHSYPHCWRCDSPLLNFATTSWFVKVTAIKEEMLELAKEIHWIPEHLKDGRFGQWLEGCRDWSISRSRYWGNTMPVWKCDQCEEILVFGSREELKKASGVEVNDLHKQIVDKIVFNCAECDGNMKRVPEVLDCWFESGSMPYGQMHYPFDNQKKFEENFPAEFIAEGVDQTRAWFYVLHILSTALLGKPAYKNVIANGIVLAEDGQKMSKRKNNYPDTMVIVNKYGADALRYYLATSPVMKAEDLCFSEKGVDEVYKKVILITQNILNFYTTFIGEATLNENKTLRSENVLDQWIVSKLNLLIQEVTNALDDYDLPNAAKPIADFVNEFSTWYLRRSRDRFKSEDAAEKKAAEETLSFVLEKLSLVMAPFMPLLAEHIWQTLGHKSSVHLGDWPLFDDDAVDKKVLVEMETTRKAVELLLALRDEAGIKVRQPLPVASLNVMASSKYLNIIASEVNVKEVVFEEEMSEMKIEKKEKEDGKIKVQLGVEISDELKLEGLLRELTRQINSYRRELGLTLNDRVKLIYSTSGAELGRLFANKDLTEQLKQATLLSGVEIGEGEKEIKVNNETAMVLLKK